MITHVLILSALGALSCNPLPVDVGSPAGARVLTNLVAPMLFRAERLVSASDRGGSDFLRYLTISREGDRLRVEHRPGELNAGEYFEHFPIRLVFEAEGHELAPTEIAIARKAVTSGGTCKFTPKVRR